MRYLFIVSKYGNDIQTNGLVLSSILNEMVQDGNEVICLSESDSEKEYDYQGVKLYSVRQGFHEALTRKNRFAGSLLEFLTEFVFYFSYPSIDKPVEKRMYRKICELNDKYHFDQIYAIYRKYSNVGALLKFKKHSPKSKCGVLFFDLLEANRPRFYMVNHFRKICRNQYRTIGTIVDKVYVPKDGMCEYWDLLPPSKREILYYPGFIKRTNIVTFRPVGFQKDKTITMLFAGTLNSTYRNPMPLFAVLHELKEAGYKVTLKLYVKGNCDSIIEQAKSSLHLDIIQAKMISKEQLLTEYQSADVLINISNHMLKATPSKVFELISTGKPILNIVSDRDDAAAACFDQYPMAHSIFAYSDIPIQAKEFELFLENAHDLTDEEYAVVERQFENHSPNQVYQSIKSL